MRRATALLVVGLFLTGTGGVRADDRDRAQAVVEQAIRAHGGEGPLGKTRNIHRVAKGVFIVFGKEHPFSAETLMQLPSRYRDTIDRDVGGQKDRINVVLNGDKVWRALGSGTVELGKEETGEVRDEAVILWLTTLLPLKDRSFTLDLLPEVNVLGKPAHAIKVTGANRPEATLIFDKQSNLLIKIERTAKQAGLLLKKEYLLTEHKDFDGVKMPTRWTELINGNKISEVIISSYEFPSRVDEKALEKP